VRSSRGAAEIKRSLNNETAFPTWSLESSEILAELGNIHGMPTNLWRGAAPYPVARFVSRNPHPLR
jgi:hypothetical protein